MFLLYIIHGLTISLNLYYKVTNFALILRVFIWLILTICPLEIVLFLQTRGIPDTASLSRVRFQFEFLCLSLISTKEKYPWTLCWPQDTSLDNTLKIPFKRCHEENPKYHPLKGWDHLFCQNLSTSGCTQSRCSYGKYIQDHFCLISLWAKATFKLKSTSWMPVRRFTDIVTQTISYWSYKRVSFSEDLCHGNKALNVCWGRGGCQGLPKLNFTQDVEIFF